MDKELLKKYKLCESQKKFRKLYEYTFITDELNEDDEDEQGLDPKSDGDMTNIPDSPPQQETPNQAQANTNNLPTDDVNDNTNDGGDATLDDLEDADPDDQELGDTLDDSDVEDIDMDGDEEVIDVDDLTDSQEETESKVGEVDSKITHLISLIDKVGNMINQNDAKIADLKKEIERRNPTEVERLNLRSQDSLPFSVSPKDYWDEKTKDSNYDVEFNNSVSPNAEDKEYVIRKGDINNLSDPSSINKTFDDDSIQDFKKIFGY